MIRFETKKVRYGVPQMFNARKYRADQIVEVKKNILGSVVAYFQE